MKKLLTALILSIFVSVSLCAQQTNIDPNISGLLTKANRGNKDAMYELGLRYITGSGVAQDVKEGEALLRKAVQKGHVLAKKDLSILISYGICQGTPEEAFKLMKEASNKEILSCYNLGYYYQTGYGTPVDYKKAAELYKKAVKYDIGLAKNNLALLYWDGLGVEQSYATALDLLINASYERRDGLNQSSIPLANYNLGHMYMNGWGVKKDSKIAMARFEQAALYQLPQALFICGMGYYNQGYEPIGLTDVPLDYEKSAKYLQMFMDHPSAPEELKAEAAKNLSALYRFGRGVERDEDKADHYAKIAVKDGHNEALKSTLDIWLKAGTLPSY